MHGQSEAPATVWSRIGVREESILNKCEELECIYSIKGIFGPKPWIGLPRSSFIGKTSVTLAFSSTPRTLAHSLIPF